jgi:hypothetical protein
MPTLGEGALTYLLAQNDRAQDAAIGAFRPYLRGLVPHDSPTIEIGPSFSPIIPKRSGFDVKIVDHADRHTLIEKYPMSRSLRRSTSSGGESRFRRFYPQASMRRS